MSQLSDHRAREFLQIAGQFRMGELVTEASHPVTAHLSEVAQRSPADALRLLLEVDRDVIGGFREFVDLRRAEPIAAAVLDALNQGGRVFFTGCGSTGRLAILLSAMWRHFWQSHSPGSPWEDRVAGVPAGGDYALIKAVEGFEDFAAFGRRQMADLRVMDRDVVFAVTEGGETSFVIGTAWESLEKGARVFFVYNNPDDVLRRTFERSREVIDEPRIEKINLTTGPSAISGSTRMQPTSIQLCALSTVLEIVVRSLVGHTDPTSAATQSFVELEELHARLASTEVIEALADLGSIEEGAYRAGHKCNYYADNFGIDVLTDTTERSPTYCTPPFRKFDDRSAAESLAFLFVPAVDSPSAWRGILKREPRTIAWTQLDIAGMVPADRSAPLAETVRKIGVSELMRFRIGQDGLAERPTSRGDCAIAVQAPQDLGTFEAARLAAARAAGGNVGLISFSPLRPVFADACVVQVAAPPRNLLLDGMTRVSLKMLLNAHSTCVMVRLGRAMGNTMVWVVPSNLKLIDRSIRYVARLTELSYDDACRLTFEVIEHVEPRMRSDRAYPAVVMLAVARAREGLSNDEAERRFTGLQRV